VWKGLFQQGQVKSLQVPQFVQSNVQPEDHQEDTNTVKGDMSLGAVHCLDCFYLPSRRADIVYKAKTDFT